METGDKGVIEFGNDVDITVLPTTLLTGDTGNGVSIVGIGGGCTVALSGISALTRYDLLSNVLKSSSTNGLVSKANAT